MNSLEQGVEKTHLEISIKEAEKVLVRADKYSSLGNLEEAVANGKAVLANEDADQETVSAAATAILNELSKAVKNADLSSLESLIKSAKKLQDGNYTSNSLAKLDEVIKNLKQPVLGICLGMQLMCRHSEEGNAECLGIFDTDVKLFHPERHTDKVPHMGWNTLTNVKSDLFKGFTKEEFVYFVHSFYVPLNEFTAAQTTYILPYSSALHKDNFYATQFHPEKSGTVGERILRNFLEL